MLEKERGAAIIGPKKTTIPSMGKRSIFLAAITLGALLSLWFLNPWPQKPPTTAYPLTKSEPVPQVPQRAQPLPLVATKGHSNGTAGDKPEEGGDDVKSSWPL